MVIKITFSFAFYYESKFRKWIQIDKIFLISCLLESIFCNKNVKNNLNLQETTIYNYLLINLQFIRIKIWKNKQNHNKQYLLYFQMIIQSILIAKHNSYSFIERSKITAWAILQDPLQSITHNLAEPWAQVIRPFAVTHNLANSWITSCKTPCSHTWPNKLCTRISSNTDLVKFTLEQRKIKWRKMFKYILLLSY